MPEIKCINYNYLDEIPTECLPIRILRSKEIYPIVWIGEKTEPTIIGWGKLVKLIFNDNGITYFIQRYAIIKDIDDPMMTIPKDKVIVTGGVEPTVIEYLATIWTIANYVDELLNSIKIHGNDMDILIPNGMGYKTYAILGRNVEIEWEEVDDEYIEIYKPSETYWIRVNDGYITDIKRLHPK